MEDIATLREQIAAKETEIREMKFKIDEVNTRLRKEEKEKEISRIQAQYGSVIEAINAKLREATAALNEANAIAHKAGIPSLTGSYMPRYYESVPEGLSTIGEMLDKEFSALRNEMYEAGIERIDY
jgi:chaperonin cofactor prefoldin